MEDDKKYILRPISVVKDYTGVRLPIRWIAVRLQYAKLVR